MCWSKNVSLGMMFFGLFITYLSYKYKLNKVKVIHNTSKISNENKHIIIGSLSGLFVLLLTIIIINFKKIKEKLKFDPLLILIIIFGIYISAILVILQI